MDELFRSFFGIPRRGKSISPRDEFTNLHEYSENFEENDDSKPSMGSDKFVFSFNILDPQDIFRHFDGIFADMENITRSFEHQEFSEFSAVTPHQEPDESTTLRDKMLKDDADPDLKDGSQDMWMDRYRQQPNNFWSRMWRGDNWSGQEDKRIDTDLDTLVRSRGLDSVLPSKSDQCNERDGNDVQVYSRINPFGAFSSSFSSTIVYSSVDGKSEEKRTTKDSRGNVETVIRRTVDGQTWTERVKKDPTGKVTDTYTDGTDADITFQKEKLDFDSRWHRKSTENHSLATDLQSPSQQQSNSDAHSIFKNIFGFEFSGFRDGKT
jgi:hypothetical protein